jgi:phosphoribosylformylglycinamidine synthase
MWQFSEAVTGLADACLQLGTPVTGGNVSFYNQTGDVAIHPTPVVGVLGVLADVERRVAQGFSRSGDLVLVLGETRDELDGSEWAHVVHGHLGGRPPVVDLEAERRLAALMADAAERQLLAAAHDVSDGGLAQTLVEMAVRHGVGAQVALPEGEVPAVALFAESVARAVVAVAPDHVTAFEALAAEHGVPVTSWGTVSGSDTLVIRGVGDGEIVLALDELRATSEATLPAFFG